MFGIGAALGLASVLLAATARPADEALEALEARVRAALDAARSAGACPGMTAAVAFSDRDPVAVASGLSDREAGVPIRPADRLLAGSVGKTFVAAVALQLAGEGALDLDEPIEKRLGTEPWFLRLPNARSITARMLLSHTSGLVRYELDPAFLRDLLSDRDRAFRPEETLAYLFDRAPPFPAGERFEYSDTNYVVLGMIVERVTGKPLREEIARRCLRPHALDGTIPSDSRRIPGLAVGYAGTDAVAAAFGGADRMVVGGEFVFNPQFEWAGGGYASTAADLARWILEVASGRAYPPRLLAESIERAVDASRLLGPGARYGHGLIVRDGTPLGRALGHSGFFPGYRAEAWAFPERRLAVALLCNTSDGRAIGASPFSIATEIAAAAAESAAPATPK
jgi:D-alanyl-D-alanine carboxypeptidase